MMAGSTQAAALLIRETRVAEAGANRIVIPDYLTLLRLIGRRICQIPAFGFDSCQNKELQHRK